MTNNDNNRTMWRFFDGSVSVSVSMLLAVLLFECEACASLPLLGYLHTLTGRDDGVIIVATLLLFPTTAGLYGGFKVFFAAKEAVERKARERGRQEGRQEGRREGRQEGRDAERQRIKKEMAERGLPLTPELAQILGDETE